MTWTKRRPATARAAIAVRAGLRAGAVAACGLLLAACSSSAAGTSAQASPSASASAGAKARDAYRQCLAQHGVTMAPRPSGSARPRGSGRPGDGSRGPGGFGGFGGGASADPAQRQAIEACASERPRFNGSGGTAMKAFTSCLKDHGVVLPSASPGAGGPRGLNTADPKSAQAFQVCKALLPQRRPGSPSPSASPAA
ncbi:hypothetical protein [Streptomyces sp. SDr-06]|uniref:hypothetical protein n=1 Tax=Streptomyces sp. SDr-06 TaxID=2267702 RepID=UPI000DE9D0DE|nr:hypothetical protein [Streptomyces sp. SDr-06]RCH67350.1 hypothetical protein DT019_17090 [Streptomyces sp. SDr-06]